jgi:hypothetical protein
MAAMENPNLRVNGELSAAVDRAVSMQAVHGAVCAVEYLKSHGAGSDVIARVLLHPQRRRIANREVMHKN